VPHLLVSALRYVAARGTPARTPRTSPRPFRHLAGKKLSGRAEQRSGRFRAFLLAALKHFLANEWDRANRQKRGGGVPHLSLDYQAADTRYVVDPADQLSPDKLYDRAWAMTLLEKVVARLRAESTAAGRGGQFEQLKFFLMVDSQNIPYADPPPRCS